MKITEAKLKKFAAEFKDAKKRLKDFGGELFWVDFDYEAFRFKSEKAHVIFYPHKTSAGHYHIRMRDAGSKCKAEYDAIYAAMQVDNPTCTFSQKNRLTMTKSKQRRRAKK